MAASIQGRDAVLHGAAAVPDRITASSHGCLMQNVDAHTSQLDSFGRKVYPKLLSLTLGLLNPDRPDNHLVLPVRL